VVIVLCCIVAYLWAIGLPDPVTQALIRRVGTGPFQVTIDRLRVDPFHGLVADGLRLFESGADPKSLLRVERLGLDLDWRALAREEFSLREVRVSNGTLRWPEVERAGKPVEMEKFCATVGISTGVIRIADLSMTAFGAPLAGQGVILYEPRAEPRGDMWAELQTLIRSAERAPPWLVSLFRELDGARHASPPRGRVDFKIFPDDPAGNELSVAAEGSSTSLRGTTLDGWNIEARLRDQKIVVSNVSISAGAEQLHVAGAYDLATQVVEARLFNDIRPERVWDLFPLAVRGWLKKQGIVVRGSMKTELWAGPVELKNLPRNFSGWVSLEDCALRGIPFEKAFASFKREGDLLDVTSIKGTVGRGKRTGPVEASFTWDAASGGLKGNLNLRCYADDFNSVLGRGQVGFIKQFSFTEAPPWFVGTFVAGTRDGAPLLFNGRLLGTNFTYQGAFAASVDTTLAYSNGVLALDPLHVTRDEGTVDGSLGIDFHREIYSFDLESTADANAVIKFVGPGLERALRFIKFSGATHARAAGAWDEGGKGKQTDIRVEVEGRDAAIEWFKADTCVVVVDVKQQNYHVTNITGTAFGGSFVGDVEVYPDANQPDHRTDINVILTNADFRLLAESFRGMTNDAYKGKFTCEAHISALAVTNPMATATGHGSVSIREGRVLSMPMFGGLSRMLSVISPGLGFASQTDFTSDFTIEDNKIFMKGAMLGGSVLSVRASGSYSFDKKLDYTVEVKPLRSGPIAAVLRLLTLPVTKLLSFHLGGTLDDPKWRPMNLPKELFLIFD